jgi:hypothetical protein
MYSYLSNKKERMMKTIHVRDSRQHRCGKNNELKKETEGKGSKTVE